MLTSMKRLSLPSPPSSFGTDYPFEAAMTRNNKRAGTKNFIFINQIIHAELLEISVGYSTLYVTGKPLSSELEVCNARKRKLFVHM